ncbi:MAG TPA: hypothetical protein VNB24_04825 [Acidimicrobiales bacterium]|nr:hypothetical protein [Acidimicrobiales bacterium]
MPHASDPSFAVLRALRVKGVCDTDVVSAAAGISCDDANALLGTHLGSGLVLRREGRLPGWALTPQGRELDAELASAELQTANAHAAVDSAYRGFLALNTELLELCTDWQLRVGPDGEQVLNDHSDPAHDAAVVRRLCEVDDSVQPVCAELAAALNRFGRYGPSLRSARAHVEAGDVDWVAKPMIDSYHSVWFELHEDLLATLGIERGSEPAVTPS